MAIEIEQPNNDEKSQAYKQIMKQLQEQDEEYLESLTPEERAQVNEQ